MHRVLLATLPFLSSATMGPILPDTTALDVGGGGSGAACLSGPNQRNAICEDAGAFPSAAACAASCDAAPACSAITWHGPTTGQWAQHCVHRLDGTWAPRACGAGCDHASANKTAGWVPAPSPAQWLPLALPWGKPKAFWFGANASGLDSADTLALLARHAVAGYGWQTGHAGGGTPGTGEMLQAAAATHLADYLDALNNTETQIFEYRQIQVALRLFAACALAADDPAKAPFFLRDGSGAVCLAEQPWGTADPYWNFSNPAAADYWVGTVIGELTMDAALTTGRGAVFFDEVDQGECGYRGGSCNFAQFDAAALQAAKNAAYARQARAMNAAGIVPIFSLDNRFADSGSGTAAKAPCALPQDDLAAALQGTTWVRF